MALENMGPAAAGAVPALIKALDDGDNRVRQTAVKALGNIGPAAREAIPVISRAVKRGPWPEAEEAIRRIQGRPEETPVAGGALSAGSGEASMTETRRSAMSLVGRLEDIELPELIQFLANNRKTGRLTLSRRDGHGVVLMRLGRILYAASNSVRETLGSLLVCPRAHHRGDAHGGARAPALGAGRPSGSARSCSRWASSTKRTSKT